MPFQKKYVFLQVLIMNLLQQAKIDMTKFPKLVNAIIEGIQEKKGHDIVVCDLTKFDTAPAQYFVVCTGNTPQQVDAIADSVEEFARKQAGEKPSAVAGLNNALWVAADYGTVMVHILVPDAREFYDIENIWADANITEIPDLD